MTALIPEGEVAWGIQLPIQAQSTRFAEKWEQSAGPPELARIARAAERAGCLYIAVCEHIAIPRESAAAMGTTWYHAFTTLGWLAACTERVRLLSHVVMPHYRHPLETAKAFLTLDALSGGRAIAGVGAGHVAAELAALGVDHPKRGALFEEALGVLRGAFEHEYPVAPGPRWPLDGDLGVAPRPVQPRIPIWVGGSSPAALRRAARLGDGWLPQGTPRSEIGDAISALRAARARAGRDPQLDIGANVTAYVGDPAGDWTGDTAGDRNVTGSLTGEPGEIAEQLRGFTQLGVNQLQLRLRSRSAAELTEQLERFGSQVAPLLA